MQIALSIADVRNDFPALSKRAIKVGPVVVTHHGRPESVLLSYAEYRRLIESKAIPVRRAAIVLAGSGGKKRPARKLVEGADRLVSALQAAGVSRILIVSDIAKVIASRDLPEGATVIPTFNSNRGFASSLKRALRYIEGECDAILLAFASRPDVRSSTVLSLFEKYERMKRKPLIVSPLHQSRRGHPVLISGRLIPEALNMDPRWGLATLVHKHEHEIVEVDVDDPGILNRQRRPRRVKMVHTNSPARRKHQDCRLRTFAVPCADSVSARSRSHCTKEELPRPSARRASASTLAPKVKPTPSHGAAVIVAEFRPDHGGWKHGNGGG